MAIIMKHLTLLLLLISTLEISASLTKNPILEGLKHDIENIDQSVKQSAEVIDLNNYIYYENTYGPADSTFLKGYFVNNRLVKIIKKIRTATFFESTIFYLKGNEIIATKTHKGIYYYTIDSLTQEISFHKDSLMKVYQATLYYFNGSRLIDIEEINKDFENTPANRYLNEGLKYQSVFINYQNNIELINLLSGKWINLSNPKEAYFFKDMTLAKTKNGFVSFYQFIAIDKYLVLNSQSSKNEIAWLKINSIDNHSMIVTNQKDGSRIKLKREE